MKRFKTNLLSIASLLTVIVFTSCTNELNTTPSNGSSQDAEILFNNPASYKQFLAKLYAGLATTGQQGPAGSPDISGIDEGFSQYIRGYWNAQELSTDEAVMGWNDGTIKDFHGQTWSSSDGFLYATYSRLAFQITNCNEFLRQTTDAKLASRNVSGTLLTDIKTYRAEARFLRALSYWHLIDMFGGGSLETEDSPITYHLPDYATRTQLFDFVDKELTDMVADLKDPNTNEQYRVDKAAAWMLKAKLLMNAKVYIGTDKSADALTAITKVISQSSYTLSTSYKNLFLADNNKNGAEKEIIFAVSYDGINTQTYGGTTYLVHASVGGSMPAANFGINGGWAGIRTTSSFVGKFAGMDNDSRKQFYTAGQNINITDMGSFTDGYAITKWSNLTSTGAKGSDSSGNFADTDFPIFRLADAYLIYAECVVRGGGGSAVTALGYVNALRDRAYGNTSGRISSGDLTLQFILDERGRELYWEGQRRTDLIRFGQFTGSAYIWPWKGNVASGAPTSSFRDIYPIPSNAIGANQNLLQNPGY